MAQAITTPKKKTKQQIYKAQLGIFIVFCIFVLFGVYCIVLIKSILEGNALFLTLALLQMVYQILFAKKNQTFINCMKYFENEHYFNDVQVEYEEELPKNNAMMCAHPHGIYTVGLLLNLNTRIHVPALSSRVLLNIPILGMLCKWWGFYSVDGNNFKQFCEQGQNFVLVPGGFEEATITSPKTDRVFLKHRKGFIKYALKYGYKVYPMYTFNENKLFHTLDDTLLNFRLFLNKLKLVTSVFYSKYLLILPDPNFSLHSVIAKGIQLPKIENPTKQDVDKYHEMYISHLKDLFNRHKARFNNTNELIIF